jgi:hypothetical protein
MKYKYLSNYDMAGFACCDGPVVIDRSKNRNSFTAIFESKTEK